MNGLTAKTPDEVNLVLNELITRVQPVFGEKLKRAILFGSYARGDYDAESDIDIMFILSSTPEK